MRETKVDSAIILAAGDGGRLGGLTSARPKVLLPAGDKEALIISPIEALAAAGITRVTVVLGYLADDVRAFLGDGRRWGVDLEYVDNPVYQEGAAVSALCARETSRGSPVVLCMGDHIISREIVRRLLSSGPVASTVCVDYRPAKHHNIFEATKVKVSKTGVITGIGKHLQITFDALDTGVFLLTAEFFEAATVLIAVEGNAVEISDVVRHMVRGGYQFRTCNVSGCHWIDVDTPRDLELAQA